ncbi:AAA family ATPase [Nitrobacter winogradskyi]|nr:AAA family ATPase [Nitrobacter winogradskyi]
MTHNTPQTADSASTFDRTTIRNHFWMLHHLAERANVPGKLVLCAIADKPLGLPPINQHFAIGDVDGMTAAAMAFQGTQYGVYDSRGLMRPDLPEGAKGTQADVVRTLAFTVDADSDHEGVATPHAPLMPNYIVESSKGNYQEVMILDRALPPAESKPLARALGELTGDKMCVPDISRIMRVPGTLNWPSTPKIKRGRSPDPQPVRVHKAWNSWTKVDDLLAVVAANVKPKTIKITAPVPDAVDGVSHDGIRYAEVVWYCQHMAKVWTPDDRETTPDDFELAKRIKLSFPGEDGLNAVLLLGWEDREDELRKRWWNPNDFKTEGENLLTLRGLKEVNWMFRHVIGCPYPPAPPFSPLPIGSPLPEGWRWTEDGRTERTAPSLPGGILPVFSAASLEGLPVPPRRWHVRDWIPAETVTLLYGDGGTGKSLIALQLLASTALGRPWLGRVVEKGACLFVTAEDSRDEVHRRLADIAREHSVPLSKMTDLHIVSLAGEDAILAAPDGRSSILIPTALFAALEAQCIALRPTFVVLDTLADLFGGNEIDRSQARQFIGLLRGLALKYDITILLLAHPSVSGMTRGTGSSGSTGWNNSVRSRLYFDRIRADDNSEPDPDARVLRSMKSNYGRVGEEIVLHWRRGVFVPDSITAGGLMAANDARNRADEVFLKMLALYDAESRGAVSPNPGSNYAPKLFAEHAGAQGLKSRALKDAMDRLLASKRIEAIMTGPPSRMRQHLIVSDRTYQLTKEPTNPIPTPCQPATNGVPTPLPTVPQTLPTPIPTGCYPNPHTPIALRAP